MPLIMEDLTYNMDDDDLFGDVEPVALPGITAAPPKGLASRLDELSASGNCQKIAWSKNGCVAYITPDGYSVKLKVFSRDPTTGKWDLGKDTLLDVPDRPTYFPYVHLSWSHLGNDLAVVDAVGHVMIFSSAMALDRMLFMRSDSPQPETEMDAVVGMQWLAISPYELKNHILFSASNKSNVWTFDAEDHVFNDTHHPMESKAAVVYLRRNGELKLRFQQADNSWHEVATQLGLIVSTREAFTHAAFASNGDQTLLLTTYDMAGQLHLYRVEINWKYTPPVPTKPGQPPPPPKPIHPELDIIEILVEDHCYPTSSPLANGSQQEATEAKIRVPAQLTHLNFLPKTPRDNDETLPTIQAIFSTPPNIVSFDQTQSLQNPYSILVRWEVHTKQQNQLHSSLDKVTSKKKSVGSVPARQVFLLNRLSDTVLHTVVLSFYPLWYNMVLAFCYSDGTIVFRKRTTMEVMGPDYNFETVTSLCQAGFAFSAPEPALHLSLSPNHCIAACMQQDGSIKLRPMEYTYGTLSTDDPDPRHSAALAALVLQTSSAANQLFSSDDIFAIAGDLSEQRKEDFILSMFQALNVDIDCGVDDQAHQYLKLLGRSPSFIKTLSSANLLGLKGTVDRSVSAKMAWQILNIKHITQLMTTVTRLHQPIEKSPIRPELIPYIIGISRWIMHFITYLLDDIFALGYHIAHTHPPNTPLDRAALEAAIATAGKSAILLILSSFPRMVMKLWSPSLTWLSRSANIFAQNSANPEVRRLYMPLHEALHELPFGGFRLFELFTMEATQLVRAAYRSHNLTDVQRNECEKQIVLGHIPDVLVPVAKRLLTDSLFADDHPNGCLADKLDYAKITFFDTTWLGLTPSNVAREWHATHTVDVCLKTIISGDGAQNASVSRQGSNNGSGRSRSDSTSAMPGDDRRRKPTQLKRCVRCGSYMEDVMHGMPGHTKQQMGWLLSLSRHCVCGNSWVLEQEKSRAE